MQSQVLWYMFVILALGELSQEDYQAQGQPMRAVSTLPRLKLHAFEKSFPQSCKFILLTG